MILNIGDNHTVPVSDIVMILAATALDSATNAVYLETIRKRAAVVSIAQERVKSIIYTKREGKETLYYSPVLPFTLLKRVNQAQARRGK